MSIGTLAGFFNKHYQLHSCDSVIDNAPLAQATMMVMRLLLRSRIGLSANADSLLFISKDIDVSVYDLLSTTCSCSLDFETTIVEIFTFLFPSAATTESGSNPNVFGASGLEVRIWPTPPDIRAPCTAHYLSGHCYRAPGRHWSYVVPTRRQLLISLIPQVAHLISPAKDRGLLQDDCLAFLKQCHPFFSTISHTCSKCH